MSLDLLDNKDNESQNSLIDDFDKKSLANSISMTEEENKEPLINTYSLDKDLEKVQKNRDTSFESSKNSDNKQENYILNLGSSEEDLNTFNKSSNLTNNKESITSNENNKMATEKNDQQEKEEFHITNYIEKLDKFDKEFSKKIHDFTLPKNVEYIVYIFARMFNPDLITSYLVIILSYKSLNNEPYFVLKPIISTVASLVFSLVLKKFLGRPRPEPSKISTRMIDLRKHEKNCSMPSGDSIQAGNWAVLIYLYSGFDIGFLIVPFVMFARIYYYCHYLFDTIVGALLGSFISLIVNIIILYTF